MANDENMKTTIIMEDNSIIHVEKDYKDVIYDLDFNYREDKFYEIDDCLTINKDKILMIRRHFNTFTRKKSKHFLEEGVHR